jgi:radical SAM protein with 4Fe4S-binding SPASM domain
MRLDETPPYPAWVVVQLLEACNLRCTMCYEWGESGVYREQARPAALDLPVVRRVLEECLPARPHFELFGGEPLLYPGLFAVLRLVTDAGCTVALPSNGILVEQHAADLVACRPTRLMLSLDGPEAVNDAQRGAGGFARVQRGLDALASEKRRQGSRWPAVGITCVVTPANHRQVAELFLDALDLTAIEHASIELQGFVTPAQYRAYAALLGEELGVAAAAHARAYVREPATFAAMDRAALAEQLERVRQACQSRGIAFRSQPASLDGAALDGYLRGEGAAIPGARRRCASPWTCAEISARGEVTTCHSFYDFSLGNVHEQPLLAIWRGERARRWRACLRRRLLPICPACCRYYP